MVALCQVQEALYSQKRIHDRTWGIKIEETSLQPETVPMICTNTHCLFCSKTFTRPRKARDHVEKLHLKYYEIDDLIPCPHPVCKMDEVVPSGHMHFKYHAATTHNIFLSIECKQ
jgi:hypothetical protein